MSINRMASDSVIAFYNGDDAKDLQELLATIAGAKSPKAREESVMKAYLLNARISRSALKMIAFRAEDADHSQRIVDADWIDARYCDWESAIRNIEYASRKALGR